MTSTRVAKGAVFVSVLCCVLVGLTTLSGATDVRISGNGVAIDVYEVSFFENDRIGRNANPSGGARATQEGVIRKEFMLGDIARIDVHDIYFDPAKNEVFRECRVTTVSGAVHECSDIKIGSIYGTDIEGNKLSFGLGSLWEEKGLQSLSIIIERRSAGGTDRAARSR